MHVQYIIHSVITEMDFCKVSIAINVVLVCCHSDLLYHCKITAGGCHGYTTPMSGGGGGGGALGHLSTAAR